MSGRSGIAVALVFAIIAVAAVITVVMANRDSARAGFVVIPPKEKMTIEVYADKDKTQRVCGAGEPLRKCGEVLIGDAFSIDVLAAVIPPDGCTRFQITLDFSSDIIKS